MHSLQAGNGGWAGGAVTPTPPAPAGALGLFASLATRVAGQGAELIAGVRNLLPANTDYAVTRTVDALMTPRDGKDDEKAYLYFDPKLSRSNGPSKAPKGAAPFSEALVVMLGGGNYTEYQNLQDYAARSAGSGVPKSIAYCATDMLSPENFLAQLAQLGEVPGQ